MNAFRTSGLGKKDLRAIRLRATHPRASPLLSKPRDEFYDSHHWWQQLNAPNARNESLVNGTRLGGSNLQVRHAHWTCQDLTLRPDRCPHHLATLLLLCYIYDIYIARPLDRSTQSIQLIIHVFRGIEMPRCRMRSGACTVRELKFDMVALKNASESHLAC